MRIGKGFTGKMIISALAALLVAGSGGTASAHCDTLDGPVIQDARKALESGDVTPVLKWVREKDEKAVRSAFQQALKTKQPAAERKFFETLVKVHRAGEGAPFTGLKPTAVEPAVAAADKALADNSADELVKLVTDDIAAGIRKRFEHAASTYKQKDETVEQGREFVEAYVEYTHYVERLHHIATGTPHGDHAGHGTVKKHHQGAAPSPHHKHRTQAWPCLTLLVHI